MLLSRSSDLDFFLFFLNAFVIENGGIRVACVYCYSQFSTQCAIVCLDQNKGRGSSSLFVPQLVASSVGSTEQ